MAIIETLTSGLASGLTLYALLLRRTAAATVWDTVTGGGSWQPYNVANIANYPVPLAEVGATGIYQLTLPAGIGQAEVVHGAIFQQVGGTPAPLTDTKVGDGPVGPLPASLTVNPVFATMAAGEAARGALVAYQNAVPGPYPFPALVDSNGNPINLTGKTIELVVFDPSNANAVKFTISGSGITLSGANTNIITATGVVGDTAVAGNFQFTIWNVTDKAVLFTGSFAIRPTGGP